MSKLIYLIKLNAIIHCIINCMYLHYSYTISSLLTITISFKHEPATPNMFHYSYTISSLLRITISFKHEPATPNMFHYSYTISSLLRITISFKHEPASVSTSHQCIPGSIPGWGSDPGIISEEGFVPV